MAKEITETINNDYTSEEFITNEVFYNEVLYLPLNQIDLSDSANMNDVIDKTKKLIPTLKTEEERQALKKQVEHIEGMIKNNSELKDVTISNMSWQDNDNDQKEDHPYGGMQAAVFTKGNEVNVVYRGTPDQSWIDNAEIIIGGRDYSKCYVDKYGNTYNHLSPMQIEAMEYMDKLLKENGDKWADKTLTVGGHSKGDSFAALAMMLNGDRFDMCFGINGPGVSPETYQELINNIGIDKIKEYQKKMYKLNEANDYVNPFGVLLYDIENIKWYTGYYNPKSIVLAHYVEPIYNIETGKIAPCTDGQGPIGKFVRTLYLKVEKLPPKLREPVCYAIMALMQFAIHKKPAVGKESEFYVNLLEKKYVAGIDIMFLISKTLTEKEGQEMLDYLYKVKVIAKKPDNLTVFNIITLILQEPLIFSNGITASSISLTNSSKYKSYKTGKVAINYRKVDRLIVKIYNYISYVNRNHIKAAENIISLLARVGEVTNAINKLDVAIGNYKNIIIGLQTYMELLTEYKIRCEESENRFIENLKKTETA